ncbi:polysaccharide biosynthesis protein [Pelagibacteraceae bacterium]|nr:polysaccharide biosynthesis protein [Pelagibacteraceae bacterium]
MSNEMTEKEILKILGRKKKFFDTDFKNFYSRKKKKISNSSFLILGAGGSIGRSVTKMLFSLKCKKIDAIDINENSLVELVRDVRSSYGYITQNFKTFLIDVGSSTFESFLLNKKYDFILNFTAVKHVRSERDIYSTIRLIKINIINYLKFFKFISNKNFNRYFSVSTDKSNEPVNLMGASKKIMELIIFNSGYSTSSARFANVAFSDGSLLNGVINRLSKKQPISAPSDIKRFFLTEEESSKLCIMACIDGRNNEIFFPKFKNNEAISFISIIKSILKFYGYQPHICKSEEEARKSMNKIKYKKWPCYFFKSDTTGEKYLESFYANNDILNFNKYKDIGFIKVQPEKNKNLNYKLKKLKSCISKKNISKKEILLLFKGILKNFSHLEKNKSLDDKM